MYGLYLRPVKEAKSGLIDTINSLSITISKDNLNEMLNNVDDDNFSEIIKICRRITYQLEPGESDDRNKLINWKNKYMNILSEKYSSNLYSIDFDSLIPVSNTLFLPYFF